MNSYYPSRALLKGQRRQLTDASLAGLSQKGRTLNSLSFDSVHYDCCDSQPAACATFAHMLNTNLNPISRSVHEQITHQTIVDPLGCHGCHRGVTPPAVTPFLATQAFSRPLKGGVTAVTADLGTIARTYARTPVCARMVSSNSRDSRDTPGAPSEKVRLRVVSGVQGCHTPSRDTRDTRDTHGESRGDTDE